MRAIDADGHVVETSDEILKYLEAPYNKRSGRLLPMDGLDGTLNGTLGDSMHSDIPTRLKDMDKEGIELSVLFPSSSFAVNGIYECDYSVAYCRAYNNYVADICRQSPRLKGVALVPLQQDPAAAVAEANRAVTKLGLVAIGVGTQGMREHLGAKTFWPLYEELERLNVPFCVHNRREGPPGEKRFDTFLFQHTIARPAETFVQFVGLMYAGVPERFPKLRIAFLETGCGWVPYWMDRMDDEWEKRGKVEAPMCKNSPSEYIKHGNWFIHTEPEEASLPHVIERIGDDKIIFASDYPHWDGLFPNVTSTIRGRKDISEQTKNRILGENAKRFYAF